MYEEISVTLGRKKHRQHTRITAAMAAYRSVRGALALYVAAGVAFTLMLSRTLIYQPLFPFKPDDALWSSSWLVTTLGDFAVSTLCLCGVIVASDTLKPLYGILWAATCCLFGSSFACAWVVQRLWKHGSLECSDFGVDRPYNRPLFDRKGTRPPVAFWISVYSFLGACIAALFLLNLMAHPLIPFKPDDALWSSAWLFFMVCEYYATTLCLCGVIIATDGPLYGTLWTLACCLLGSPLACAWIIKRLSEHGSLKLEAVHLN